jgi:hypothetical protein
MGQKHQAPTAEDGVKALLRYIRCLGVHFPKVDLLQPQGSGVLPGQGEHLWRQISGHHMPSWPDTAGGSDGWLAETSGNIQHPLSGLQVCQLDQPFIDVLGGLFKAVPKLLPATGGFPPLPAYVGFILDWIEG